MNTETKKSWHKTWFWILFATLVVYGVFTVFSFWIPYFQWKHAEQRIAALNTYGPQVNECASDDKVCREQNLKNLQKINEELAKIRKIYAPLYEVKVMPDVVEAMRHPDGTVCFRVEAPTRDVTNKELKDWLKSFGTERFHNMAGVFLRIQGIFEDRYHFPDAKIVTLSRFKWNHFPFGKTWRMYNTAECFLSWLPPHSSAEKIPENLLLEILPNFVRHSEYFTEHNFSRLLTLAKAELHSGNPNQ